VGDLQSNLVSSLNLLRACCELNVGRVIFLSSGGTVYGIPQVHPTPEDHPTQPISAYGVTKLMVEKYLQMYRHLHGLEYTILRPSVPYGPRQNPLRHQGVVTVFIYNLLMGKPVTIFGDGETVRDFFYIEDLTSALLAAKDVAFDPAQAVFNLGGGQPYTLNQLVRILESVLGVTPRVEHLPPRNFDVPRLLLDTGRARARLNWAPRVSLEEGIRHTAAWMRQWMGRP
jgi:UDP-glucose 4-epimerase